MKPYEQEALRLDVYLTLRGYFESRSRAVTAITQGRIAVNGTVVAKNSYQVLPNDAVSIIADSSLDQYVSRGALKLEKALADFKLDITGFAALDIGSSTGGFTDCLLQHGASTVFAVDVGTQQMHPKLRNDPRVKLFENQDIRTFTSEQCFDIVTGDLSFISLHHILPLIPAFLKPTGISILLIKPQFEVGSKHISKKGIVKNENETNRVKETLRQKALNLGLKTIGITPVPIIEAEKNKEYLWLLKFEISK